MDTERKIKTCSKSELANSYGVHTRTLMRWIKRKEKLYNKLIEGGYQSRQTLFEPKQIELIFEFIGTP